MLEKRRYNLDELAAYLRVNTPAKDAKKLRAAIAKKLEKYNVEFTVSGREENTTFEITQIQDPLKVFFVFEMDISPQTDFTKFEYFFYLVLNDDGMTGMNAKMVEEYLRSKPINITRQTISKYIKKIIKSEMLYLDSECVYYRVNTNHVGQTHEIVSREEYSKAWKIYWNCCEKGMDSLAAYHTMYDAFGGVPRKYPIMVTNAFFKDEVDWISEQLCDKFERE